MNYEPTEFEILYEPEHWNQNCGCMIPAAWVAYGFTEDGDPIPKWPCGDTREEAEAMVRREYPHAVIVNQQVVAEIREFAKQMS